MDDGADDDELVETGADTAACTASVGIEAGGRILNTPRFADDDANNASSLPLSEVWSLCTLVAWSIVGRSMSVSR